MRARERELLQKVLIVDPQQPEARARLGYVKSAEGHWITGNEELETKKVELAQKRVEAQQQARAQDAAAESVLVPAYPSVLLVPGVGQGSGCAYGTCMPSGWKGPKAFPIPGVRDPRDMTFSIPGARDPRDPY